MPGIFKTGEERSVTSPPLKACKKHSPLWTSDPEQQLGYFAIRSFARRYIPELLGGVYMRDEFEEEENPPANKTISHKPPGTAAGLEDEDIDEVLEDMGEYAESDDEEASHDKQKG